MGATKENIRFHTSVLCASNAKFLFARDNKTINGDYYVVTFRKSSFVTVEHCSEDSEDSEDMYTNRCNELYKSVVNLHQAQMYKILTSVFKKISEFMSDSLWYTVTLKFNQRSKGLNLSINDNPQLHYDRFVISFKNFPFFH
jgi:hypothetical protein